MLPDGEIGIKINAEARLPALALWQRVYVLQSQLDAECVRRGLGEWKGRLTNLSQDEIRATVLGAVFKESLVRFSLCQTAT